MTDTTLSTPASGSRLGAGAAMPRAGSRPSGSGAAPVVNNNYKLLQVVLFWAGAVLLPLLLWRGQWPALRQHWRALVAIGVVGTALPFALITTAALALGAGLMSVFNATAPIWAALIAKLNIAVTGASKAAVEAVEKAGGKVTLAAAAVAAE